MILSMVIITCRKAGTGCLPRKITTTEDTEPTEKPTGWPFQPTTPAALKSRYTEPGAAKRPISVDILGSNLKKPLKMRVKRYLSTETWYKMRFIAGKFTVSLEEDSWLQA